MTKSLLLLSCAMGALSLSAGGAFAATATATATATDNSQNTTTVTDIVVVAEKREQSLQKIPVAVSVFTGAERDTIGINSVQDVTNFAPGFVYDPNTVHAYIRGVGRQSINVSDTARVAAYEDEFYVYSPYQLDKSSLFLTQEQIERGPQNVGGRNADGGSIDMISVRPTDNPYAEVRASVGNFGTYEFQGAVSGQIAPNLDARLSAYDNQQTQGFYKNLAPGLPSEGNVLNEIYIEGQIDAKPTDNSEFWLRAFYSTWNNRGDAGARGGFANGPWDETNLTDANEYPGAGLFVNPNYGYAGIAGPARNAVLAAAAAAAAGGQVSPVSVPVLGDTTLINPNVFNNPSATNPNNFIAAEPRTDTLKGYDDVNYTYTYHFPTVDFKYTGGFQGYNYTLNYSEPDTAVSSYVLPGSTSNTCPLLAGFGLGNFSCTTAFALAHLGPAPAQTQLVINPLANVNYVEDDWWTSHEFVFESTDDGPFQWIGGLYYYFQHYTNPIGITAPNQTQFGNPDYAPPTPTSAAIAAPLNPNHYALFQSYNISQSSIAAYGQVSYKFSDQFKITANLRYTEDYKAGTEFTRYVLFSDTVLPGVGPYLSEFSPYLGAATPALDVTSSLTCATGVATSCASGKLAKGVTSIGIIGPNGIEARGLGDASGAPTGGIGIEWTPNSDTFIYAKYSRGYEELTFNAGFTSASPEVNPEYINDFEAGYKQSIGHSLLIDTDVFYYDYEGLQLPISVANQGVTESEFINAPKSVSAGFEAELYWTPVQNLVVTGSYSYDYTAIETSCFGTGTGASFTPSPKALCVLDTNDPLALQPGAHGIAGTGNQSVKGDPLPNAPANKLAIDLAYTFHFDAGALTLSGDYAWRDTQDGTIFNRFYDKAPSWDDVDFRALWKGPGDKYEIIGFVKNIFNTLQYETGAGGAGLLGNTSSIVPSGTRLDEISAYNLAPPRTYGLEVRYKFF